MQKSKQIERVLWARQQSWRQNAATTGQSRACWEAHREQHEHPVQYSQDLHKPCTCWALIQTQLQPTKQVNTVPPSHGSATTSPNRILFTPDSHQGLYPGEMSARQYTGLVTYYTHRNGQESSGQTTQTPEAPGHLIKRQG